MRSIKFSSIQSGFFFGLITILGIVALILFLPFLYSIFWAAVIAVMLYPFYSWLNGHLKHEAISAVISVILSIIVIVIPLVIMVTLLIHESSALISSIVSGGYIEKINAFTASIDSPLLNPFVERIQNDWAGQAATVVQNLSSFVFTKLTAITQNLGWFSFLFFIMLYTLYYFFKDGKRMLEKLMYLSPLGDSYEKMLYGRFTSTTRATLKSTLLIGLVQGLLGWIIFAATGVKGAFVWAMIMLIVSIIPAVGAILVWLPVSIALITTGNVWQGISVALFGGIIISNIDNLLRPYLVGKDIQMHPLFVLFSTLGGILVFGPSGFIIGPVIMALFLSVMSMYSHYYKRELRKN